MRKLSFFIVAASLALLVTTILVLYAKGYRLDLKEKTITGTGIISINSKPTGAAIYLDGTHKTSTNNSIQNLKPGTYQIKLHKDGFIDWQKKVVVKEGAVTSLEALLFPATPNLKALTFTGVIAPVDSPDGQKIAYATDSTDKEGLWILDLTPRQLFFAKEPEQIAQDTADIKFSDSRFIWAADSHSLLVFGKTKKGVSFNYLLNANEANENLSDITDDVASLKKRWKKEREEKINKLLNTLGEGAQDLAKESNPMFSPDEKRMIIIKPRSKPLVYDSDPSSLPNEEPKIYEIPSAFSYIWYPETSKHIILVKKGSIGIVEVDGTNDMIIYTGAFDKSAVFPWPDGSKLVIVTSLNNSVSKKPNLYSIDLH